MFVDGSLALVSLQLGSRIAIIGCPGLSKLLHDLLTDSVYILGRG